VPGRFKDFIAMPKLNMYQSLHTTVIGPHGEQIEIQIRTRKMHRVAEEGIAAHWKYKEGKGIDKKEDKQFAWLRQLVEWQRDLKDPKEFLETVKVDLFQDEVYVFTPKGDIRQFPKGSTPLDFAYSIHTDVGHRCVGAKVDGKLLSLRYQLKSGDTVEIITGPDKRPARDWLKFVKTSRARTKIKSQIKSDERGRSVQIGKEMCEKEFKKQHLNYLKIAKSDELGKIAKELSFQTVEDLMAAVGYGKISPRQIVGKLIPREELEVNTLEERAKLEKVKKIVPGEAKTGIRIGGVGDVLVHFGKCCHPLPGDDIVGFITRGRGLTVHTLDCPNLAGFDPKRKVNVEWDEKEELLHPVKVEVICDDRPGMLSAISNSFGLMGINISDIQINITDDKKAVCNFLIQVKGLKQLNNVLGSIKKIKMVDSVKRLQKNWGNL
jgi:GTP pyrophosphokinase